jgi:ElaB/YqjD/DUF883 family membrane-anchored ribosome-binding protein
MEAAERTPPGSNDGNRTSARSLDTANAGGRRAIERASDAMHPAVDRLAAGAHQAIDKMAGAADQAAQSLGAKGEQLMGAQTRALDLARGYVRANPLTALSIAAATGYLIGRLLTSR